MLSPYQIVKKMDFERIAGSKNEQKAIQVIGDYLQDLNLKPKFEEFEITAFDTGTAKILVKEKEFLAHPFGLNEDAEISGELLFLENADVIERNLGAFRNRIIMSYGFSRSLAPKLKKAGIIGYIGIGRPDKKVNSSSHRQKTFQEGYINSVNVDYQTAEKLRKFSGKEIKLQIEQKVEKRTANNIVVDIPGKSLDDNLTIACGHYDTVALSPGASDNTAGVLTLLKIAEYFQQHQPGRDLRLIFFSGEELGLLGSQNYVERHLDEIKEKLKLIVNIDVSGDAIGRDVFNIIGTKELTGYIDGITQEKGMMFASSLDIYSSDAMPFTPYEIPSVNVLRVSGKGSSNIHTADDNYRNVSRQGYDNTIKASINLLDRILNAEIYPVQKEIDEKMKDKIEKYLYNLNYQKPELEWTPKYKK